jgi:polar amino acid transport system substrate-binding protein
MVALGTLVSGVAHEINNPNNFIMLNTPLLREAWESALPILEEYYQENGDFVLAGMNYTEMRGKISLLFSGISDGSKRIKRIVDDLKSFVRKDVPDVTQPVDINDVLKSALALVSNMIYKSTKNFSVRYNKNIPLIKGNFQRLEQVVINLIQNACQALPDRERAIRVSTFSDKEEGVVTLRINDQGRGIPAESLPHITDPFFTTKQDSGGVGLGLSISERIVEEHGGRINFTSRVGKGTQVEVVLPFGNNS